MSLILFTKKGVKMAKERVYKEHNTSATFIKFLPNERWRNMSKISDGTYYVSDKGRIMRLNAHGIFNEIGKHLFEKAWYVGIAYDNGKRIIYKRHNIARLVLQHFTGGDSASNRRRFVYVDGNKSNLRLSNLRWKTGFAKGVDFWYLRKLKNSSLNADDRIVKSFLLTDDIKSLFNLLLKKEGLLRSIDYKRKCGYFEFNDYTDFILLIRDRILAGDYKPSRTNYYKPNKFTNFVASVFSVEAYNFAKERSHVLPLLHDNFTSED